MTRDERIAAGWEECWGLFDLSDGKWMAIPRWTVLPEPGTRRRSFSFEVATKELTAHSWTHGTRIVVRRFWRRKKPKAPPQLKVGDEVVVRGKIEHLRDTEVNVRIALTPGIVSSHWFQTAQVERVRP